MQAAEPCPQEEPLKEVLLTLGLPEAELTDLHDVSGVQWRLNLQSGKPFDSFCVFFFGVAVSHFWEVAKIERDNFPDTTKFAIEICQQRRLHVGPSTTSTTEEGLQSGGDQSAGARGGHRHSESALQRIARPAGTQPPSHRGLG